MPLITGLRADLVAHEQWLWRQWFYADESALWYYHRPRHELRMVADRQFYALVDPELRELCQLLHGHGLRTTPSCEGHFYPEQRFQQIYKQLQQDQAAIRGQGLAVKDSETGQTYLFREESYRLPWSDYEEFFAQVGAQQGVGYLGVLVPRESGELGERLGMLREMAEGAEVWWDEQAGAALGARVLGIRVRPSSPEERRGLWGAITRAVGRVVCPRISMNRRE